MFAEPVTEHEILTEIDNLSTNKSAGHDNISAKMIKTIKQEICKPLAHIFNLTFDTGLIPESLKIAIVILLFLKQMKDTCLKIIDQFQFSHVFQNYLKK